MSDFSLDLNEDQLQMQKWVHDFAENVIRPVAAEYDEKEETPWPVIQEAANIGLYSQEAMTSFFSEMKFRIAITPPARNPSANPRVSEAQNRTTRAASRRNIRRTIRS